MSPMSETARLLRRFIRTTTIRKMKAMETSSSKVYLMSPVPETARPLKRYLRNTTVRKMKAKKTR
jgi:hypothetical protein